MKTARIFNNVIPTLLLALLAGFLMSGCKDQENTAIAESGSREIAAVPITTIIAAYFAMNDEGFGALRPFLGEKNSQGGGHHHH